jgi:acetylglutamate kinase
MEDQRNTLSVVKIGGGVIEDPEALKYFCKAFSQISGPKILVHGGGKSATALAEKLEVPTKMIEGRRCTPKETLEVITMTYAGSANKTIVSQLQADHCNALGLSGADGNSISAVKRNPKPIDYGFVGDQLKVNTSLIEMLLSHGICPVFCAITHDGNGQLLNTNADTIASEIAIAMTDKYRTHLWYCFEKPGVLVSETPLKVLPKLSASEMKILIDQEIIHSGMIPKLTNGFHALEKGVHKVGVGNEDMLANKGPFTLLKKN